MKSAGVPFDGLTKRDDFPSPVITVNGKRFQGASEKKPGNQSEDPDQMQFMKVAGKTQGGNQSAAGVPDLPAHGQKNHFQFKHFQRGAAKRGKGTD
jgi:hypothetical protein